jgi:Uma2 family endonuclease
MNDHEPRALRWTRDEYLRLCEQDWFQGKRVQLIGGEIVEMSAQYDFHFAAIDMTKDALTTAFGPNYWVRAQASLDLSPNSVPDPDVAVISGPRPRHATRSIPTTALLVVEVADTTLSFDRHHKASLYAASGIADYWIVNLVQRQLEVYRDPVADPTQPFAWRYASRTILDPGDSIAPLAAPQAPVAVADLLP